MQPEQMTQFQPQQEEGFDPVVRESAPAQPSSEPQPEPQNVMSWQASEFIQNEKNGLWFLALFGIAAVLIGLAWWLQVGLSFIVLLVVMTLALAVIGRRQPRIVTYSLTSTGIHIDQKSFQYSDFKFFGVVQEGAFYSIRLIPHKRFMPMVSVYLPSDQAEQIVDVLGSVLPLREVKLDIIDRFAERLHF